MRQRRQLWQEKTGGATWDRHALRHAFAIWGHSQFLARITANANKSAEEEEARVLPARPQGRP